MTISNTARTLLAGGAIFALAACDAGRGANWTEHDYRYNNPVVVQSKTAGLLLDTPAQPDRIGQADQARLREFAGDFQRRGTGLVDVSVSATGEADARARAFALALGGELMRLGVPHEQISVQLVGPGEDVPPQAALLSFRQTVAKLPECSDSKDPSIRSFYNTPAKNFGCAVQRNIAVMASDPRDLVESRDLSLRDANRSFDIIGKYQKAQKTTGAEAPAVETTTSAE